MRLIASILILCLLAPLFPIEAEAQLLINPGQNDSQAVDMSQSMIPELSQSSNISNRSNAGTGPGKYTPYSSISDSYKLGPGDQLETHLIVGENALSIDYDFAINPEGKIFFPNVGEIVLSGKTLKQARLDLNSKISKLYKEKFSLSLMVASPRLIKIYVSGQVKNAGLMTVYNGSKASEIANNLATLGSSRNLTIKRKNQEILVDLYKVWYKGDIKEDKDIEMGDIIEIPPQGSARVTIMGEVARPGLYEIEDGEKLRDALIYAGYTGANSVLSEVAYLKRKKEKDEFDNQKLNLYDLFSRNDETQNIELSDGDIISIPSIKSYVYVYGEVSKSGRFDYDPGKKVADYVNFAGGPTVKADLGGVTLTRQEKSNPRVMNMDLSEILQRGNKQKDVEVFAGDVIFVPGNFFYFADISSFAQTILIGLTLYNVFAKK